MVFEGYKMVLTHYIVDSDTGKRIVIDEPIITEQVFDRSYGGSPIILNRMFNEMKEYTLNRMAKE